MPAHLPDPDEVASHAFTKGRKGYDADEVRAYLLTVASEVREAQRERADLERRLIEAEQRSPDPKDLDEAAMTQLLGAEAARLLDAARQAGVEIRTNAEEHAAKVEADALERATSTREAADAYADAVRASANEFDTTTRAAAESVLADRTAEAELAAKAIRDDADTYSRHTREAADFAKANVDVEVEAVLAGAREEGRAMVDEAREYRERVIADLTDRRRGARAHVEELAAARDEFAVALSDVITRLDAARALLDHPSLDPDDLAAPGVDRHELQAPEPEPDPEPEPEPEPEPTGIGVGEIDPPEPEPEPEPKVESLFARIREETEPEPEPESSPDADLLDRRDGATDEIERQLARRLKRVLSDEQNEVLDALRRARGNTADVLPELDAHVARHAQAALEDLRAAERAGAGFFGEAPDRVADVSDSADAFALEMVRQIRTRLERAVADGGDETEVGERIRACYREWKTQRIADTASHYVVTAFSRGVVEAAADGTMFRWVVDDGETPSPDCEDNALAGGVVKGEPFPTGDLCPPAHPGCRCLVVPVDA